VGALNLIEPHDLTVIQLLEFCQELGVLFDIASDGQNLKVTGRLDLLGESLRDAITSARDELLALVFCQANGLEYFAPFDVSQHLELRRLINELCDKAPHGKAGREAMLKSSLTMREIDVPHCIEHYRICLRHVASGTYWSFKQDELH
jgi:hypothetical protein